MEPSDRDFPPLWGLINGESHPPVSQGIPSVRTRFFMQLS